MPGIFVTGTDTEVGKTVVSGLLGRFLLAQGYRVITQKWLQTGSADAMSDLASHLKLMKRKKEDVRQYLADLIPYSFALPASPHLAAEGENQKIDAEKIKQSYRSLSENFDFVIVEGSGGVLVPYSEEGLVIDIARDLKLPVLIVVSNKLGAINHTLLTVEALRGRGMPIIGLIFNGQQPRGDDLIQTDNPRIISKLTMVNSLGHLPRLDDINELYDCFQPLGEKVLKAFNEQI